MPEVRAATMFEDSVQNVKAVESSEICLPLNETTRRHITEYRNVELL
jgi:hypothetical protein